MNIRFSIFNEIDIYNRVLLILLLLFSFALIFPIVIANVILSLLSAICLILTVTVNRKQILKEFPLLTVFILLYFFLEVIGVFYTETENIKEAFFQLEKHLPFVTIPLIFLNTKLRRSDIDLILLFFVAGCFVAAIICTVVNLNLSLSEGQYFHEYYFSYERISEPIGMQPVYFALYQALAVLIIVDRILFKQQSYRIKTLLALLALYLTLLLIASGARTATVAIMFLIVFKLAAYIIKNRAYKVIILAALVPIIFVAIIYFNPVVLSRFVDLTYNTTIGTKYDSYFARTEIWKSGWDVLEANYFFGVGTGDQESELLRSYDRNGYSPGIEFTFNMHNQYMQTVLCSGIIGLVLFLWIAKIQVAQAIRNKDFLYLSFIMLFLLACVTESTLNRNKGVLFYLFFSLLFFKRKSRPLPEE